MNQIFYYCGIPINKKLWIIMMQFKNGKIFGCFSLVGQIWKWLMGSWFLWNVLFKKPSPIWPNTLCPIKTTWRSTWENIKWNTMSLVQVWKKIKFIMRKNNKHSWNLVLFAIWWPHLFYNKWTMIWQWNIPQECAICYTLPHFAK